MLRIPSVRIGSGMKKGSFGSHCPRSEASVGQALLIHGEKIGVR
jgi:hypothetical protein